jgi:hypothetical protein
MPAGMLSRSVSRSSGRIETLQILAFIGSPTIELSHIVANINRRYHIFYEPSVFQSVIYFVSVYAIDRYGMEKVMD